MFLNSVHKKSSILNVISIMGIECIKGDENTVGRQLKTRGEVRQIDMRFTKQLLSFDIRLNNLRFCKLQQVPYAYLRLESLFNFSILASDFSIEQNFLCSHKCYQTTFSISADEIETKTVICLLEDRNGNIIDKLKLSLHQICNGPVHNDHLLRNLKSRIMFDLQIDQIIQIELKLKNIQSYWQKPQYCFFRYQVDLIIPHSNPFQIHSQRFQKHEKIKQLIIPRIKIKHQDLKDTIIKIRINSTDQNDTNIQFYQILVPFTKLNTHSLVNNVNSNQINFECRKLTINETMSLNMKKLGSFQCQIIYLKSKLYVEQMECVIQSENGIVITTPSLVTQISQQKCIYLEQVNLSLKKIRAIKASPIYSNCDLVNYLKNFYLSIVNRYFNLYENIQKIQEALVDILIQLSGLLQIDEQVRNQYIFKIIDQIIHQEVLSLKYFNNIANKETRKKFALKYYNFIISTIIQIIISTASGITYKEMICVQKFIAFSYFRLPWCQEQIITILSDTKDPEISQQKLAEFGASLVSRSPSKSFYYDWQSSIYNLIKYTEEFKQMYLQLKKVKGNYPRWAKLLFDREYQQLFYGLYTQLWNEAQLFLNNNGRIMWQYFPHYGQLLSIFIGEMNRSKILDFSSQMTKCNIKLMKNQKLLNTFMMLIFTKTCLYQTYCVIKCLDLIKCYFDVFLSRKTILPQNFHFHYFYAGIRCIFESNHSYLLMKALTLIYTYYPIFTNEFKAMISGYILNKMFYQLFMHWSQDVRNLFHLLLVFKIAKHDTIENPEINFKKNKDFFDKLDKMNRCQCLVQDLKKIKKKNIKNQNKKVDSKKQYYEIMKQKLEYKKSRNQLMKPEYMSQKIQKVECIISRKSSMSIQNENVNRYRKWSSSYDEDQQRLPTSQQLKYLSLSLSEYQKIKSQPNPDLKVQERSKALQSDID